MNKFISNVNQTQMIIIFVISIIILVSIYLVKIKQKNIIGIQDELSSKNRNHSMKKALIIDDDEGSQMLMSRMLMNNFKVIETSTCKEALQLYKKHKPDLIIIEVRDFQCNAIECIKEIREKDQTTPIIAQTAYAHKNWEENAYNAGCNESLHKPIGRKHLNKKLSALGFNITTNI